MGKQRPHLRTVPIRPIAEAIVSAGYTSLEEQARALGLHRNTTWTIMRTKHKFGLNPKTAQRILEHPDTPHAVRAIIQEAFATKLTRD